MAHTFTKNIDHFERMDRQITGLEMRRNIILREIERHRATVGQQLRRSTPEAEDVEFEEIETSPMTKANAS
jgi:hypothetical protein